MFQVDAFASRVFGGNPAGVVPLAAWLPDRFMQAIAAENNVAETAFFVPATGVARGAADFHIRWFTPTIEIDLCGHATLASAHVLFRHLGFKADRVRFSSHSGPLDVFRQDDRLVLDFPSRPAHTVTAPTGLADALGAHPTEVRVARDLLVIFDTEETVRLLTPEMSRIAGLDAFAVIVTAPASTPGVDFVSRFFAPRAGVPEDPATGSAHCTLIPYWAARLGRAKLHALQVSPRGGELFCEHRPASAPGSDDRVYIGGQAVTYFEGAIHI